MADSTDAPQSPNFFDADVTRCPQATYRQMVDTCPVSRMPITQGLVVASYEDVMFCLRHPEIFSSEMSEQLALGTDRPMIPQQIDPPAQTRYRKILDPRFSHKRMTQIEPAVRASARRMIEPLVEQGGCDFSKDFAVPFPCESFLHLLGLPLDDLTHLIELKDGIIRPQSQASDPLDGDEIERVRKDAGRRIYDYFGGLIKERRTTPRDDLMSYLVQTELDGKKLTDDEVLDISFLFILAGLDTVTATLDCSIAYLAANPAHQARLVKDPALIENAIEEMLRWETPVSGVPRVVKQDAEIAGHPVKAGEMVLLLLGAANIDPGEFTQAEAVDFDRDRNRHIAFGGGPHRCLGSHLARMELRVGLEEWHRLVPPYKLVENTTLMFTPGIRDVDSLPLTWT